MTSLPNSTSQKPSRLESHWKMLLECAALEVFEMMAGVRLQPNPTPAEEPRGEHIAMVGWLALFAE